MQVRSRAGALAVSGSGVYGAYHDEIYKIGDDAGQLDGKVRARFAAARADKVEQQDDNLEAGQHPEGNEVELGRAVVQLELVQRVIHDRHCPRPKLAAVHGDEDDPKHAAG